MHAGILKRTPPYHTQANGNTLQVRGDAVNQQSKQNPPERAEDAKNVTARSRWLGGRQEEPLPRHGVGTGKAVANGVSTASCELPALIRPSPYVEVSEQMRALTVAPACRP